MELRLQVQNNRQNTKAGGSSRDSNKVFTVRDPNSGHTPNAVNTCLRLSAISSLITALRIDADRHVTEHNCFHRNSILGTFADLDTLCPCVIKLCAISIATVLEPGAAASTTAAFASLLGISALVTSAAAHSGHTRCRGFFCGWMWALVNIYTT